MSTEGAPCYFDHSKYAPRFTKSNIIYSSMFIFFYFSMKCAWCTKKSVKQCAQTAGQQNNGCYSYCGSAKDPKCDGNPFNCYFNDWCGTGASCVKKTGGY